MPMTQSTFPSGKLRRAAARRSGAWSALPDWHSHAERTVESIRFLKRGVAVVLMHVHFSGRATFDFNDTFVLIRKGHRWQISLEETAMPPDGLSPHPAAD
jgi:hypothetical protein